MNRIEKKKSMKSRIETLEMVNKDLMEENERLIKMLKELKIEIESLGREL